MSFIPPYGHVNPDANKKYHWSLDVPNLRWFPPRECLGSNCTVCHLPKGIIALNKSGSNANAVLKSVIAYNKKHGIKSEPAFNNYFASYFAYHNIKQMGRKPKVTPEPVVAEPVVAEPEPKKRGRGRPRKYAVDISTPIESGPVESPTEVVTPEPVVAEPVVAETLSPDNLPGRARGGRKKYGNCMEVWHGQYLQTRSGLTKDDLMQTAKGKIVTKKQYDNLKTSSERLKSLKVNKEC